MLQIIKILSLHSCTAKKNVVLEQHREWREACISLYLDTRKKNKKKKPIAFFLLFFFVNFNCVCLFVCLKKKVV